MLKRRQRAALNGRGRWLAGLMRGARVLLVALFIAIAAGSGSFQPLARPPACEWPPVATDPNGSQQARALCWALIGNDGRRLAEEFRAGIRYKVFELDWAEYRPEPGVVNEAYVAGKHDELAALRNAGFGVILSLGLHNPPRWIHAGYANSYYVNQYGDRFVQDVDGSDVNLIFNPELRDLGATYIHEIFAEFGTDFAAVRLGGGRYGELSYPPASYNGRSNCYWSFDRLALARSPTPGWEPGDAAHESEARAYIEWYLDQLVDFQSWQITAVRAAGYEGGLMMLYPSWGIRPGELDRAVRGDLLGLTPAEQNGEIQRGYDFARQVAAIRDPKVIVTTTWLDADASGDGRADPRFWSPVKYLAFLAHQHPLHLATYGENTGQGTRAELELSSAQVVRYGLAGMAWLSERDLFSGRFATLADYARTIAAYSPHS